MHHVRLDRKGFLKRLGAITALAAARPAVSAAERAAPASPASADAGAPVARKAPRSVSRHASGA